MKQAIVNFNNACLIDENDTQAIYLRVTAYAAMGSLNKCEEDIDYLAQKFTKDPEYKQMLKLVTILKKVSPLVVLVLL